MGENPHRDKEWFEDRWYNADTLKEIADEAGVSKHTITTWARKHDLPSFYESRPYNDADYLERLYHDEGLTLKEIGERHGVSKHTIFQKMKQFGIERRNERQKNHHHTPEAQYYTHPKGYEYVASESPQGTGKAAVHQLLAVSKGTDPHDLFSGNFVVHHKNGVKWDNRPENIRVMTNSEHAKLHHKKNVSGKEGA